MSTPQSKDATGFRQSFGYSQFTPKRCKQTTPHSRRLIPTTRRKLHAADDEPAYEGLLCKQWKTYSLSPLFNFKQHPAVLRKYERSLDAAFAQVKSSSTDPLTKGLERSHFSFYEDVKFHNDDPTALRIEVYEIDSSGSGSKLVFEAFLVSVELTSSPIPASVQSHFTYFPLALVAGTKGKTNTFFDWLESHFDCRSDSLTFSDSDLKYMLTCCSAFISGNKPNPVLLQYSTGHVCTGIDVINCKLEAKYCKMIWDKLFISADTKAEMFQDDVDSFISHIENILENLMSIYFKKLSLSEVGTHAAYISHLGKIKIFTPSVVYAALHLLCEISNDKFLKMIYKEQ